MKKTTKKLTVHKDDRGRLIEILHGEDIGISPFGQVMMTTVLPGKKKGGHYHMRKNEWFCTVSGQGTLFLENKKTKQKKSITLSADAPQLIRVTPFWAHTITNSGREELIIIIYIDEAFNPEDPDVYYP